MKKINQLTDSNAKNLFGFSRAILAQMCEVVLPVLERAREDSLRNRADRKPKGGELTEAEKEKNRELSAK